MKKLLIGLVSLALLAASIFGVTTKGPRERRGAWPGRGSDRALWI